MVTRNFKRSLLFAFSTFVFLVAAIWFRVSDHSGIPDSEKKVEETKKTGQEVVEKDIFGIPQEVYRHRRDVIRRGQTLSHIFGSLGFSAREIHHISGELEPVFNPSRFRHGHSYHIYTTEDSLQTLEFLVYEINDVDYLLFDFRDSLTVSRSSRPVTKIDARVGGVINSSLWNTVVEKDIHPELVLHLSRVLAWSVDFHRIHPGDEFRVLFTEKYIGEQRVGVAGVDAVHFVHRGREIEAYRFESDTLAGYYDGEGNNVRKAFLRAPLEYVRITSRYSHSRLHPIHGDRRPHLGTDYAAPHGTPILAVGDGVVTRASYTSGNGNYVRIRHTSVYETQYLHMSRFARDIKPGARVEQGDVIGYVGSTGLATGPHVCFRFWKNGRQVDHLRLEFPSGDPLPEDYLEDFMENVRRYNKQLQKIDPKDAKIVLLQQGASPGTYYESE